MHDDGEAVDALIGEVARTLTDRPAPRIRAAVRQRIVPHRSRLRAWAATAAIATALIAVVWVGRTGNGERHGVPPATASRTAVQPSLPSVSSSPRLRREPRRPDGAPRVRASAADAIRRVQTPDTSNDRLALAGPEPLVIPPLDIPGVDVDVTAIAPVGAAVAAIEPILVPMPIRLDPVVVPPIEQNEQN
jgi:hypothetical protein